MPPSFLSRLYIIPHFWVRSQYEKYLSYISAAMTTLIFRAYGTSFQ